MYQDTMEIPISSKDQVMKISESMFDNMDENIFMDDISDPSQVVVRLSR